MVKKTPKYIGRKKRHQRLRNNISGTAARPRLNVFRSNKHIFLQIIDDNDGKTIVSASTQEKDFPIQGNRGNVAAATAVGELIGKRAKQAGIETIVFDRGGYLYHGRIKAVADGARSAGLQF